MTRIEWVDHPLRKNGFTPFHSEPRQVRVVRYYGGLYPFRKKERQLVRYSPYYTFTS
jgi:hypothetical protein